MASIKEEHKQEITKYLQFFCLKKNEFLKDFGSESKEFQKDNLLDDIYNKDEVIFLIFFVKKIEKGRKNSRKI